MGRSPLSQGDYDLKCALIDIIFTEQIIGGGGVCSSIVRLSCMSISPTLSTYLTIPVDFQKSVIVYICQAVLFSICLLYWFRLNYEFHFELVSVLSSL